MSNRAIFVLSLIIAVALVWIKGQERIQRRPLTNVPVTVENLPANWMLPEPWTPPRVGLILQGPRTSVEMARSDLSSFQIDLSEIAFPEADEPLNLLLRDDMFRTNLEADDRARVNVVEDSVRPRQVRLEFFAWNVEAAPPQPRPSEGAQISIPLYRVERVVPIDTPTIGSPPEGFSLNRLMVTPPELRLTGSRDALERIESVSTQTLDLSTVPVGTPPIYLPLEIPRGTYDIRPAGEEIRGVTVTLEFTDQG